MGAKYSYPLSEKVSNSNFWNCNPGGSMHYSAKVRYQVSNTNADLSFNEEYICSDADTITELYEQKSIEFFNPLNTCLMNNNFDKFMNYYNKIIDLLQNPNNDYSVSQEGVRMLHTDMGKIFRYIQDELTNLNSQMTRASATIQALNEAVVIINQKLNFVLDVGLSDDNPKKFQNGVNDTKLNQLKFLNIDEGDNKDILITEFFERIINFCGMIDVLNNNPLIEKALDNYMIPEVADTHRYSVKLNEEGILMLHKQNKGDSGNHPEYYNVNSLLNNNEKAQANNTIRELLGVSTGDEHLYTIQQSINRLNEINTHIGFFRAVSSRINNSNKLKEALEIYIRYIEVLSNNTLDVWTSYNRNSINHDISGFKEIARILCDNDLEKSLNSRVLVGIDTYIDNYFNTIGQNFIESNKQKLFRVKDNYIRTKRISEKLLQLRIFNQTYQFKCQKFGNQVHLVLGYNTPEFENYLLNPKDDFRFTPNVYSENIGPLCIKDANPNNINARNVCFDYETMDACKAHLLQPDIRYSDSSFRKSPIDDDYVSDLITAKNQIIYDMQGKVFNVNSKLHDLPFSNVNQGNVDSLTLEPNIAVTVPTTTTTTTTTQYIHTDVDSQPPTTTRRPDPNIPDDVIPNGVYFLSIVENGVEKYMNLFNNTSNNTNFIKKTDLTPENKNNSIVVVNNFVLYAFRTEPDPVKFISINYLDNTGRKYYLQTNTNNHNDRIIVVEEKDTSIYPINDFNYYLPVEHNINADTEIPTYEVHLKSAIDTTKYCDIINNTDGNVNLESIRNDPSVNSVINNLLGLNGSDNLPIIGCKFDDKNTHFKFELKESI
jgi:hypothetical protein